MKKVTASPVYLYVRTDNQGRTVWMHTTKQAKEKQLQHYLMVELYRNLVKLPWLLFLSKFKPWQRCEEAFNELTYYQEWLLKKGHPLWKVRIIYHWQRSCTYMQLLKSIVLGSAKQLFSR